MDRSHIAKFPSAATAPSYRMGFDNQSAMKGPPMGLLNIRYNRGANADQKSLAKRAQAALDRIAADVLALRPISSWQARLYAQTRQQQHAARLAELKYSVAAVEDQRAADFAELEIMDGDAEDGDAHSKQSFFERLEDEATDSQD